MAVRSTTARRLATVLVSTAAVSALGAGAASAATGSTESPTTDPSTTQTTEVLVPPLSLPQVGLLLNDLLGTVDGLAGTQLGTPTATTDANKDKPLLEKTVANLTGTTKDLPLLGGVVGKVTDGAGLSSPTKVGTKPSGPETATPATPAKPRGRHHRAESVAAPGSTWTAPMTVAPVTPAVSSGGHHSLPIHIPGFVKDVTKILPSSAAEAAAGAGAATVALIVLGGVAITGAAGAASTAGRRGLINGSVGGSL